MSPNYRRTNHIYNFGSQLSWSVKDFVLVRFSLNGLQKQSINFVILFLLILAYYGVSLYSSSKIGNYRRIVAYLKFSCKIVFKTRMKVTKKTIKISYILLIFPYILCMQLLCCHFKPKSYSFTYPFFLKGMDMLKQPFFYFLPIREKIRRLFLSLRKSFRDLDMILYHTKKLILKSKHLYKGKLLENLKNSIFPGRLSFLFQNHPT